MIAFLVVCAVVLVIVAVLAGDQAVKDLPPPKSRGF